MTLIGGRIQRLRDDIGLSQADASARSPISQATWSRIESGAKEPHLGEVAGIAAALGCFVSTVLGQGETLDQLQTAARTTGSPAADADSVVEELGFFLEAKAQLRVAGYIG
ncbi:helix-turn-helix domain-containing protein [Microbacterium sp. CJ88]|uniref:helix-turn-helix domain-containing protein n=1 Tax=Microbacterium sp. CJ88 TaxID=3445672 RepID=UPI003F65910E